VFRVADEGMSRALGTRKRAYLWTLNAPSTTEHSLFLPGQRGKHGPCNCWKRATDLGVWNARQSKAWNHLRTVLRDHLPDAAYFRAVEVQTRGALHLHILVVVDEPLDVAQLHEWARTAGFGCVMDLEPLARGSAKAARYVSKYVSKACDLRGDVPWVAVDDDGVALKDDPYKPTYRTHSQSGNWPCSMREVVSVAAAVAGRLADDRVPVLESGLVPLDPAGVDPPG
jgi:hypothetical protein